MRSASSKKAAPKRQSRLTFTPTAAPSSEGAEHSPGTNRVVGVRFLNSDGSPQPKKSSPAPKLMDSSPSRKLSDGKLSSSSDEESIQGSASRRRTPKKPVIDIPDDEDEDEDDSDEIVTSSPMKRRRTHAPPADQTPPQKRQARDNSGAEESDLAADVADLQDSDTPVTKTRTRGRAAVSATKKKRTEQLEALRRRRAGGKLQEVDSSLRHAEPSKNRESEEAEESGDDEEYWANKDSDDESAPPEDLDEYEADFIVENDDSELGAPAELEASLPFEFSRHRYKRLRDHFKDVVEWMVHNKLNPAFSRDDEVYQVAFSKVTDEVTGLAGSQLVSSVWNPDFERSLKARPHIEITDYPVSDCHPCDACNRSGHPASYDIRLLGKPYSVETLEPLADDDSEERSNDEGDEDEESSNVDREGYEIPDSSKHFYLGRHCKSKAAMAHTLIHWRYHLNEWVLDYLRHQGVFSDSSILERERWTQKRRTKFANETVDLMEKDDEIKRLFRDFNLNVKTAKGLKESRW